MDVLCDSLKAFTTLLAGGTRVLPVGTGSGLSPKSWRLTLFVFRGYTPKKTWLAATEEGDAQIVPFPEAPDCPRLETGCWASEAFDPIQQGFSDLEAVIQ